VKQTHISGVVITLNEEANIQQCILSMSEVCDEIIIIDSRSIDRTEEICTSFDKVKFITQDWLGYSATKNEGATLTSNNFILSLDADERLDAQAINAINILKTVGLTSSYSFNRKNYYGDKWVKHGGWYPDKKIRLYNKVTCKWEGDYVHETLQCAEDVTVHLKGNIEHYTISSKSQHLQTIHKYAKLAAQRDKKNGKSHTLFSTVLSCSSHFLKKYVIKLGFLDGELGFEIAWQSAKSKWLRYKYAKSSQR
jgi:glycosyltransferase involved in cell wall biosynthesis